MKFSISRIKLFKACRRAYELKYIEGIVPVEKPESLQTGTNYHKLLEELNECGELPSDLSDEGYSKEMAMAYAYFRHIYPTLHVTAAEEWFEKRLGNNVFVGRVDGIADDGNIVEYKTISSDTFEYEAGLNFDEQILMYMWLTGKREMWYVVCRKPTIRQKQNESDEEFFNRMVDWYDSDTDSKIRKFLIVRSDKEVDDFVESMWNMAYEINHAKNMYRNTCHCKAWGRTCEYAPICLSYDPDQEYIGFQKEEVKE